MTDQVLLVCILRRKLKTKIDVGKEGMVGTGRKQSVKGVQNGDT